MNLFSNCVEAVGKALAVGVDAGANAVFMKNRVVRAARSSGMINRGVEKDCINLLERIERSSITADDPALNPKESNFLTRWSKDGRVPQIDSFLSDDRRFPRVDSVLSDDDMEFIRRLPVHPDVTDIDSVLSDDDMEFIRRLPVHPDVTDNDPDQAVEDKDFFLSLSEDRSVGLPEDDPDQAVKDTDFFLSLSEDRSVPKVLDTYKFQIKQLVDELKKQSEGTFAHGMLGGIITKVAQRERGPTEIEFAVPESLQKTIIECPKNGGHEKFIPVRDLTLQHLPPEYRHDLLLDHIRLHADLTVRVSYPGESGQLHGFGSGWVRDVEQVFSPMGTDPCRCDVCKHSRSPRRWWWRIKITTASHCIRNDYDAGRVLVDLFYNRKEDLTNGKSKRVKGYEVLFRDAKEDWCTFYCATHDENLANRLQNKCDRMSQIHQELSRKFGKTNLVVIVSHPHGLDKQVSFGKLVGEPVYVSNPKYETGGDITGKRYKYYYNTPTCPGSSGAGVWRMGVHKTHWCGRAHKGGGEEDNSSNYSAVGFY